MNKPGFSANSETDWEKVDRMTDEELSDEENPPLDEEFWAKAVFVPGRKKQVTLRLDPDVLEFFKRGGPGYQKRINAVLRRYMEAHTIRKPKDRRISD